MAVKMLGVALLFVFLLWKIDVTTGIKVGGDIEVTVQTSTIINKVEKFYLSYTIDSNVFSTDIHWYKFNFSSPKIHTLMKALSPSILRIGGTSGDVLFYNKPYNVISSLKLIPGANVITWAQLAAVMGLLRSTGNRLAFGLNIQTRFGLQWDPSNAIELLEFCSQMNFCESIDWELGNEPDWFDERSNRTELTGKQIGNDFVILKTLLSNYNNCRSSGVIGPDVGRPTSSKGSKIFTGVADLAGSFLKGFTFHHYYFDGKNATYKKYIDPSHFSDLARIIDFSKSLMFKSRNPNVSLWLGETSDAYNSGTKNVSDRFVSGFLWLDKLGLSAAMGLKAVFRQTLYGGYYSLLDINMDPNPDYWLSWLHKELVGQYVFGVTTTGSVSLSTTRVYAHCTKFKGSSYQPGALTVFALNVNEDNSSKLKFTGQLANQTIDVYLLEADGPDYVLSKWVKLNGKRLVMPNDDLMPIISPVRIPPGTVIELQPLSMGFFVFPNAKIPLCQQQ